MVSTTDGMASRSMRLVLEAMRAAGEATRLRILVLLARTELTVSELTQVLHQSQPRVSRHLKLLNDAGLVERHQEGTWVFYRLTTQPGMTEVARTLVDLVPRDDGELQRDQARLGVVRKAKARAAGGYFRRVAAEWDRTRSLLVDERRVEQAMLRAAGAGPIGEMLDLGTGTGRILEVFAARVGRGTGIDSSPEMLTVARVNLERRELRHCRVRKGDIYDVPFPDGAVDLVTVHHVLHFLADPAAAIVESARVLAAGGRLVVVDFAPHQVEFLRAEHEHRRLGFRDEEVTGWCRAAGLQDVRVRHLRPVRSKPRETLTVSLWTAVKGVDAARHFHREVA